MGRRKRLHLPGVPCHVTARIQSGDTLFAGYEARVTSTIVTTAQLYRVPLLAYAVMANHIHIVPVQTDAPLGIFMHALLRRLAIMMQRAHGRTGHVFCGPYYVNACLDPDYLRQVIAYVHLNPVRAFLCSDAAEFAWSSHRQYLYCNELAWRNAPVCAYASGLRMFAQTVHCMLQDCVVAYQAFLRHRLDCDGVVAVNGGALPVRSPTPMPLFPGGNRHWLETFGRPSEKAEELGRSLPVPLTDISTIAHRILSEADQPLSIDELRLGVRTPPLVELRRAIIARCLLSGHRSGKIARYLRVSTSTVSRVATELRQQRPT